MDMKDTDRSFSESGADLGSGEPSTVTVIYVYVRVAGYIPLTLGAFVSDLETSTMVTAAGDPGSAAR